MRNKLIILLSISLFLITSSAYSQKLINSPYSRFNIGTLEPSGSFRSQGMGGISVGMRDNSSIYFANPASYSSIDTNSFVFDFGLDYSRNKMTDGVSSFTTEDANFDHLLMGLPITKGFGFAVGMVPVSNGYYKMAESVLQSDPGYDPSVGEYSTYHAGEGGLTNVFLGSGIKLNKNFSVGVNMNILFGQIKRVNQFAFADYYNVYNNNSTERLQIGGVNFDYGIQYFVPIKKDFFFNAGASFSSGKYLNSKYENYIFRYTAYSTVDTISYVADNSKSTYLPGGLKLGISFGKINKLTAGFDYITTKWSKSKIPGSSGYAADTKSFLFGLEFIPDKFSNYSFIKRMEYRVGGHVGSNYLIINNEQVKEIGASVGIGIPMMRSLSKTNLFFDYTRKNGSALNNLHTENYYTVGISLNLYDFWFYKQKYE
jgi:hypothetical protein